MSQGAQTPRPPRAPWGAFPLSELTVLAAIAAALYCFVSWGQPRAIWAAGAAASLGSLAGLEVAIREHFAGFRPHTTILAATAAVAVSTVVQLAGGSLLACAVVGLVVYLAVAPVAWRAFVRRR